MKIVTTKKIALLSAIIMALTLSMPIFSAFTAEDRFNLVVTPGCKETILKWNKVPEAKYYWPQQVFSDGSTYPLIDFASEELTFTHKDLEDVKEYCYFIKATDDNGKEVARSSKVCAKSDCSKTDENCKFRMEFVVGSKYYTLDGSNYGENGSSLQMDSPPVIVNNRTMMAAKYVVENINGGSIIWDGKKKEVTINLMPVCPPICPGKPTRIIYTIGKSTVNVDGINEPIDKTNPKITPLIINGRTMLPFRNLGEKLGAVVDYVPSDKRIILDFHCNFKKKVPIDDNDLVPVFKTICGCIDSITVVQAKGPGVPATVKFLKDCDPNSQPLTFTVNSYLAAQNSPDQLYNNSDIVDPNTNLGYPRPNDGWDMPSYVGNWEGNPKPGNPNDRTWCAKITYWNSPILGIQNQIVSWEMHPEKEECCTEIVCACIYGYDEDVIPGHIRLFVQDDCIDQPAKLHTFSVPFNMGCTNPPTGSTPPYKIYNYIGDYPNGTTTGTVNGVTKKKWCIKYKTNSNGDFLSWEMTPDNCECDCVDTCKGCLVSLTPTPSCTGNIIPQTQWSAVFDFDCNPSTTNDRTTYTQASVSSSTTPGSVYISLANLWRRCNCSQTSNTKTFTTSADFDTGVKQSVDHNPTADQLEIQYPVTTTPFPHIWVPNWNDYTVSKVSTTTGVVLARYRVSSKTANPTSGYGPSRTTVDKDGNCWVGIRDTGSVVKILNIPVDNNGDGLITSQNESDLKAWGQDDAIQYEVILDHTLENVYRPTINGQVFTGTYAAVSGPRGVAVDEFNNVWIGTRETKKIYKITQTGTSASLSLYYNINNATYVPGRACRPYGAVIDKCGNLWITSTSGVVLKLNKASTSTTPDPVFITGDTNFHPYALTLDSNSDYLYLSSISSDYIYSIPTGVNQNGTSWDPGTGTETTVRYSPITNNLGGIGRGIVFDRNGHLWAVDSNGSIKRFTCNAGIATHENLGVDYSGKPANWSNTSGIAMDTDGKMWVGFISNSSGLVYFTPPSNGIYNTNLTLTPANVAGGHYTYSDMTGLIVNSITAPTGHWTTPVIDAGCENPIWSQLQYQSTTPGNSSLAFYCSSSTTGIPGSWSTFAPMQSPYIPPAGIRYIKIQVLFRSGIDNCEHVSPILQGLKVNWTCQASVNCCADVCLDGGGKIVSIAPRIGQEPCCESRCQWTGCGIIQSVQSNRINQVIISVKDCQTGQIKVYQGSPNLFANNASSISWTNNHTLVKYEAGNCAKYCIVPRNTNPQTYEIVEWEAIAPTDPCCCLQGGCYEELSLCDRTLFIECFVLKQQCTSNNTIIGIADSTGQPMTLSLNPANFDTSPCSTINSMLGTSSPIFVWIVGEKTGSATANVYWIDLFANSADTSPPEVLKGKRIKVTSITGNTVNYIDTPSGTIHQLSLTTHQNSFVWKDADSIQPNKCYCVWIVDRLSKWFPPNNNKLVFWIDDPNSDLCKDECKWICGCFRKNPNNTIYFDSSCNGIDFQQIDISGILNQPPETGSMYNWDTIGLYVSKMHDQEYWCADVCVINGVATKWRIDPNHPYPNCCSTTPSECCEEMKLEIPLTDPVNVLGYQNVSPQNCVNPGTKVKFSRMVVRNNCNYPICIKITGSIFVTDFFVAKDYSDYQNNIPITQPITIPANSSLQYLYGHFTIPECNSTKKTVFSVKQVDCTTGQDIPECIVKVYVNCCLSPECPECPNNIVKNWGFTDGLVPGAMPSGQVTYWSAAYGSPDVGADGGCCDPGRINMWGNKTNGEAIQQSVAFVAGHKYKVSFYGRRQPDFASQTNPGDPPIFVFRASTGSLTGQTGGTIIGTSTAVTTADCVYQTLPEWTANANYDTLTVNITNDDLLMTEVSKGLIDRICITEILPSSCCENWEIIIPSTEPANVLTYMNVTAQNCVNPGTKVKFSRMEIKNNCNYPICVKFEIYPPGNGVTDFFIAKDYSDYQSNIPITQPVTIPANSTLKYLYGHFTVPASFPANNNGRTVFRIFQVDCNTGQMLPGSCAPKFSVNTCPETCCDWELKPNEAIKTSKLSLCPGETSTITSYEVVNNCPAGSAPITFNVQKLPISSNIQSITPTTFTLNPGERKQLSITVKMPDCKPDSTIGIDLPFSISTNPQECGKSVKITIFCKDCRPCCDWTFEGRAGTGIIPTEMCPGESTTTTVAIINNCPKEMQFQIDPGTYTSVSMRSITVPANTTKSFTFTFKMPECKPGQTITASYTLTPPSPCEKKTVSFNVNCKSCEPSCCNWLFRVMPSMKVAKLSLCVGEEATISYNEIFNACNQGTNNLNFTISWPTDGKIASISPSTITNLAPQKGAALTIKIKMPKCEPGQSVTFPFVIDCKECGKKEVNITATCKDCWCEKEKIVIKITKFDLNTGNLEGTQKTSGKDLYVKMQFDKAIKKWSLVEVGKCYEICYETRSTRSGNYFFALDYREVACPKSAGSGGRSFINGLVSSIS